jgi:energy-coupling factor transporter ATP-binding protein EcfA2
VNCVEYFEVEGFWGDKRVRLDFHDDINFLIGSNGSGKTTVINLLSAVLQADIPTLYSIQFERVLIRLKTKGANKKPVIEVAKVIDKDTNSFELVYTVKEKSSEKGTIYRVEGPFDERIYHDPRFARSRRLREEGARLGSILGNIVEVNWLSVHRTVHDVARKRYREEELEPSVDIKIREISRAFAQYFSLLQAQADKERDSFQEAVFLSLLDQERDFGALFAQVDEEPADKTTVTGILRGLGVAQSKANRNVTSHLSRLANAKERWKNSEDITIDDAVSLSDAYRVNEMVKKWRHLQEVRNQIFAPRDNFEKIINSLYSGKEIHFDERNVPTVHLKSKDEVDIGVLSSGEKQLFILLGEAVLQEDRPVVFISDEPELSLHVSWQSGLFRNIRSLNGSCQIISATHSPDIVGHFQDRVIKIEDCFY